MCGEFTDNRHGDIRIQQGAANFADGCVNVCLREAALATQVFKGCRQTVRERIEHEP